MKTTTGLSKIDWVDNLKAIGIIAVIIGHMPTPLTQFIFSWHMPLFVFISGFFVKNISLIGNFKKDFKRLMLPFIVFALFPLVIIEPLKRLLFPNYPFITPVIDYWGEITGIFYWMDINHLHHYGFVLWFLPVILLSKLILFILNKYIKYDFVKIIISLVMFMVLVNESTILPFGIDKAIFFMPWITVGNIFYNKYKDVYDLRVFILLAILLIIIKIPFINLALKTFDNSIYGLVYSLVLILCFVSISKFKLLNILGVWGRQSMFLLIVHPYVNNLSYVVMQWLRQTWIFEVVLSLLILAIMVKIKIYAESSKYASFVNWF